MSNQVVFRNILILFLFILFSPAFFLLCSAIHVFYFFFLFCHCTPSSSLFNQGVIYFFSFIVYRILICSLPRFLSLFLIHSFFLYIFHWLLPLMSNQGMFCNLPFLSFFAGKLDCLSAPSVGEFCSIFLLILFPFDIFFTLVLLLFSGG